MEGGRAAKKERSFNVRFTEVHGMVHYGLSAPADLLMGTITYNLVTI